MGEQGRSREKSKEAIAVFQVRDDSGLACSVNIGGGQILGIFQMLMLSERSQTKKKKTTHNVSSHLYQILKTKNQSRVTLPVWRQAGEGREGWQVSMRTLFRGMDMFITLIAVMVSWLYTYI